MLTRNGWESLLNIGRSKHFSNDVPVLFALNELLTQQYILRSLPSLRLLRSCFVWRRLDKAFACGVSREVGKETHIPHNFCGTRLNEMSLNSMSNYEPLEIILFKTIIIIIIKRF